MVLIRDMQLVPPAKIPRKQGEKSVNSSDIVHLFIPFAPNNFVQGQTGCVTTLHQGPTLAVLLNCVLANFHATAQRCPKGWCSQYVRRDERRVELCTPWRFWLTVDCQIPSSLLLFFRRSGLGQDHACEVLSESSFFLFGSLFLPPFQNVAYGLAYSAFLCRRKKPFRVHVARPDDARAT